MSIHNVLAEKQYEHPYTMKQARWIREHYIFEKDEGMRKKFLVTLSEVFGKDAPEVLQYIGKDYRVMIRDDQMWPDFKDPNWDGAVWSCGRAWGKTWAGAPATIEYALEHAGCHIGLFSPTFGMGRDNMILNASGIIKLSPEGFKPKYNKSEGSLEWPNGSTAKLFSAENGDRVRGQNFHFIWGDEFAFFKFTGNDKDLWKMGKLALRAGPMPKFILTTSPRPIKALKDLHAESQEENSHIIFRTGTTFDNYMLPSSYIRDVKKGEGTSLYNQEILGMILDENPNAIFSNENILRLEIDNQDEDPDSYNERMLKLVNSMDKIVVSVDPNVVEDIDSDETGVTVVGRKGPHGFIFKDASRRGKISDIYAMIVELYHQYRAAAVVVETNNGGDFIPTAIYNIDPMVVVEKVFASRGKRARAEPIGMLYERHKIYHIGIHRELEAQMCEYNPTVHTKSPDRMDSMVWGLTFLFPSSMTGLFDTTAVHKAFAEGGSKNKKEVLKDLHQDLYDQEDSAYGSYDVNDDSMPTDDYDIFDL